MIGTFAPHRMIRKRHVGGTMTMLSDLVMRTRRFFLRARVCVYSVYIWSCANINKYEWILLFFFLSFFFEKKVQQLVHRRKEESNRSSMFSQCNVPSVPSRVCSLSLFYPMNTRMPTVSLIQRDISLRLTASQISERAQTSLLQMSQASADLTLEQSSKSFDGYQYVYSHDRSCTRASDHRFSCRVILVGRWSVRWNSVSMSQT